MRRIYMYPRRSSGNGLPPGGLLGQVLAKLSGADYDAGWITLPTYRELPAGGSAGQYLKKLSSTDGDAGWDTLPTPREVPSGGTTGQYLRKTGSGNNDYSWQNTRNELIFVDMSGTDFTSTGSWKNVTVTYTIDGVTNNNVKLLYACSDIYNYYNRAVLLKYKINGNILYGIPFFTYGSHTVGYLTVFSYPNTFVRFDMTSANGVRMMSL